MNTARRAVYRPLHRGKSGLPADAYIRQAQANLDAHLLPYVAAHPETQFDIFFPPYSAAGGRRWKARASLESMLALRSLMLCAER